MHINKCRKFRWINTCSQTNNSNKINCLLFFLIHFHTQSVICSSLNIILNTLQMFTAVACVIRTIREIYLPWKRLHNCRRRSTVEYLNRSQRMWSKFISWLLFGSVFPLLLEQPLIVQSLSFVRHLQTISLTNCWCHLIEVLNISTNIRLILRLCCYCRTASNVLYWANHVGNANCQFRWNPLVHQQLNFSTDLVKPWKIGFYHSLFSFLFSSLRCGSFDPFTNTANITQVTKLMMTIHRTWYEYTAD